MDESKWKTKQYESEGYSQFKVKRTLYVDKEENPKYKFKEKIEFIDDVGTEKPYAICIGYNPACATTEIDETNKRLIKLLKDDYCGYYLYNIYPEITGNKMQVNLDDKNNISFIDLLENQLEELNDIDVILFFGRTTLVPQKLHNLILIFFEKGRKIFLTTHAGEFTHPGSNASIQKECFEKSYFKETYHIKIK